MLNTRTEARWFSGMLAFLIFFCVYLFVFRGLLLGVEQSYQLDIFKPELGLVAAMVVLVLLYHFCFAGLYFFSQGGQWQKLTAVAVGLLVTGGLLYGFGEWYRLTSKSLFLFSNNDNLLPLYAREKAKFLITNIPLILFLLTVFVFRIMMMFQKENTSDH
jgi:hypothetical protein